MRPDTPHNYYFGGGATESFVTPVVGIILIVASLFVLFMRRKYIAAPFLMAAILVPGGQVVVLAGAHLMIFRILIFVAWLRIFWSAFLTRSDPFGIRLNSLDRAFVAWSFCNAIMYTILWGDVQVLINRMGFLYVSLGVYFMFRYLLRDREDVMRTIKTFAVLAVPIAVAMSIEHSTRRNMVAMVLGGGLQYAELRNGLIRAQGPFSHAIVAGTFGAMLLPLLVCLWREGKGNRLVAGLGILSVTAIAIASASSTPIMTYLVGVAGLCFWPFRKNMRAIRRGFVVSLVLLQLVMEAPVWFLIARLSALTGGTGWHRAELIDQFVRHLGEWWLIGTQNNASWGVDMWDSINAYVNAGVEGGLITFTLFICIFVYAFKRIGAARRLARNNLHDERLLWALGCCLFSNTVAFFGIVYFDQSVIAWYVLLAMISAMTALVIDSRKTQPKLECVPFVEESIGAGIGTLPASYSTSESLADRP